MEANIERLYNPNDYFKCLKCGQKWSHAPSGSGPAWIELLLGGFSFWVQGFTISISAYLF